MEILTDNRLMGPIWFGRDYPVNIAFYHAIKYYYLDIISSGEVDLSVTGFVCSFVCEITVPFCIHTGRFQFFCYLSFVCFVLLKLFSVYTLQCISGGNEGIYKYETDDYTKGIGSKFGAVLAAVDLNNDGMDELLIGAPLYTGTVVEEGRVYVYTSQSGVCAFIYFPQS